MKLGIMQPYFVPYIGYWQLINTVDTYIIYDDVNYIKGGWINRNRILVNEEVKYFNVQLDGASPNKLINEISVSRNEAVIKKNLRILESAYGKAPYFKEAYPVIKDILFCESNNLADYLVYSIEKVCQYLNITTQLIRSSDIPKDNNLRGQEKVLEICRLLGAKEYYNAIGGRTLYSYDDFKKEGINLKFLQSNDIVYQQYGNEFISNLSIIDVMMFNSQEKIGYYLNEYSVISQENDKVWNKI